MTHKTPQQVIEEGVAEKEEQLIKHLVDRFLGWRLPDDFHPDGGIIFMDVYDNGTEQGGKHEPVGTNLFTAEQAKQMFRFLLENEDGTSVLTQLVKEVEVGERERCSSIVEEYGRQMSENHDRMIGNAHKDSKMMLAFDMHSRLIAVKHITKALTPPTSDVTKK